MSSPVRVMIFEPYPMNQVGGNLRTLSYILEKIDRKVIEPVIVAPMDSEFIARTRANGTECIVLAPPDSVGRYGGKALKDGILARLRNAMDIVRYNLRIARLLRQRQFDVIYANSIRAVLFVGMAARLTRTPMVWYVKGELNNAWLDRFGFAVSNRILFFCEANRDDKYPALVRKYAGKIGVLRIGMDLNAVRAVEAKDRTALKAELGMNPACVNTVVVGQLYRPKGQNFAIEALAAVVKDHPNVKLYIVGDHVIEEYRGYRAELDSLVARLGLQDHVVFTGWRTDALDIVASADILVHPSLSEGFGRAVLEAMALGRPVVASRVGGLREAIRNGENGFLVTPGDVAGISAAWSALVADPALREQFSRGARREVEAHYQLEDKVVEFSQLWSRMAAEGSPRVRNRR